MLHLGFLLAYVVGDFVARYLRSDHSCVGDVSVVANTEITAPKQVFRCGVGITAGLAGEEVFKIVFIRCVGILVQPGFRG